MKFVKMQALGNDFVVLEGKSTDLSPELIKKICHRQYGIGCDQLIIWQRDVAQKAAYMITFYNADGSLAGACGNGTRCVAGLLMQEHGFDDLRLYVQKPDGGYNQLRVIKDRNQDIQVNMGRPAWHWQDIPLAKPLDCLSLALEGVPENWPVMQAISMGNPHLIAFFDQDIMSVDLAKWGAFLEHHPLLPQRANISIAQLQSDKRLSLRVWERGAGLTLACGSAACAAVAAAKLIGKLDFAMPVTVEMPGGQLCIDWPSQHDDLLMTGGYQKIFIGEWSLV